MLPWFKRDATQKVLTSIWLLVNNVLATVLVQACFCLAGFKELVIKPIVRYCMLKLKFTPALNSEFDNTVT